MKQNWKCPKCQSDRVGYLESLVDADPRRDAKRMIGNQEIGTAFGLKAYQATGPIEAFVCTVCGYFEEYVRDADKIDWQSMQGFRWCRSPKPGSTT